MPDNQQPTPIADDIIDPVDVESAELDREADAILAEARAFAGPRRRVVRITRSRAPVTSIRAAVREDLGEGRMWVMQRTDQAREAVQDEPIRATLYALGAGVLIGLLLSR